LYYILISYDEPFRRPLEFHSLTVSLYALFFVICVSKAPKLDTFIQLVQLSNGVIKPLHWRRLIELSCVHVQQWNVFWCQLCHCLEDIS